MVSGSTGFLRNGNSKDQTFDISFYSDRKIIAESILYVWRFNYFNYKEAKLVQLVL